MDCTNTNRETCMKCRRGIYTHQFVVACCLDGYLYHGSCFKFDNDTVLSIQQQNDWFCPDCCSDIIPHTNDNTSLDNILVTCKVCTKYISNTRDVVSRCLSCDNIVHHSCSLNSYCNLCFRSSDCTDLASLSPHFNPYNIGVSDDNDLFNDDFELYVESINIASNILENCNYVEPDYFKKQFDSSLGNTHTSFYFQNIDGMKTNFDESVIHLKSTGHDFDFISFCETNLNLDDYAPYSLSNTYNFEILSKSPGKNRGSGMVLYYKRNLHFTIMDKLCNRTNDFEMIGGKLKTDFGFIHVISIYRYHKGSPDTFLSEMNGLIESLDGPCLIFGDVNINCFAFDDDSLNNSDLAEKYINNFMSNGFSPCISKGTRFDNKNNNTITCIDQIWFNMITSHIKSGVFTNTSSDHHPIFALIPTNSNTFINSENENITRSRFNITSKTTGKFSLKIDEMVSELQQNLDSNSISQNFSCFHEKFSEIHDECFLESVTCNSRRNFVDHPWITTAVAKSCKTKSRLYKTWLRAKGSPRGTQAYENYKFYRSKLRDIIRESKIDYFKKQFQKSSGNLRKSWNIVNQIRCKYKKIKSPTYLDFNGQLITNRMQIACQFNKYFTEVAQNLNNDKYGVHHSEPSDKFLTFMKNKVQQSMFFTDIDESEIIHIINGFNNHKSSDFSVRAIKLVKHQLSPLLVQLFNDCMYSGIFPQELKIAKVIPLFKGGKDHIMSNYRPISILPIFSKIFEKLIYNRLYNFFDKNNILYTKQFGFRRQHSTSHALNTATSTISRALDNNYKAMGIFIDFSKAFDTINHYILLKN